VTGEELEKELSEWGTPVVLDVFAQVSSSYASSHVSVLVIFFRNGCGRRLEALSCSLPFGARGPCRLKAAYARAWRDTAGWHGC
jgi:hypothetical protein